MRYALLFFILFFAACSEPATEDAMPEAAAESAPSTEVSDAAEPEYSDSDVPPVLINADEVRDLLQEEYPANLKAEGVGGRVVLWLRVDQVGAVAESRVQESSGYEALDEAAQLVALGMQFSPAENKGEPVSVWIAQPIDFRPES